MNALRERRMRSDLDGVMALVASSADRLVLLSTRGTPPDQYMFLFRCRSVVGFRGGAPDYGEEHTVRVFLPADYPAVAPIATMLSPLQHPHVWPNRTVCLGTWSMTEKLDSVLIRLASTLVYHPAALYWRSVANEAVVPWAQRNLHTFPLDTPIFPMPSMPGVGAARA